MLQDRDRALVAAPSNANKCTDEGSRGQKMLVNLRWLGIFLVSKCLGALEP